MECLLKILGTKETESYNIDLSETPPDNLIYNKEIKGMFYSDWSYSIKLELDYDYDFIELYINNIKIDMEEERKGIFKSKDANPFINLYGYINFNVFIRNKDKLLSFYSGYYDIAVRDKISNRLIRDMIMYIMSASKKYLFNQNGYSKDFVNTTISKNRNFDTEISLIDNIIMEYERNYKYFKSDKKFKITNKLDVDNFNKLKNIDSNTIHYILTNPQYLRIVQYNTGIKYNRKNLEPAKTLINKGDCDYNIYENKIILSFLKYLYKIIDKKRKEIDINNSQYNYIELQEGYCSSGKIIRNEVDLIFKQYNDKLEIRRKKIYELYIKYRNVLKCDEIPIKNIPKSTFIFTQILHYRKVYSSIIKWFYNGNYDMKSEKLILTFPDVSTIYEYYLLFKIINYICSIGYKYNYSKKINYVFNGNCKYKNTEYENMFSFGTESEIVLYYQPVLYSYNTSNNIGLFKNNTISFDIDQLKRSYYYSPDYIIKLKRNSHYEYIIIDAKWQYIKVVQKVSMKEIIYKYVFSLSTIDPEDDILKVVVINGKISDEQKDFVYKWFNSDYKERCKEIRPQVEILSLNPDNKDSHKSILKELELE